MKPVVDDDFGPAAWEMNAPKASMAATNSSFAASTKSQTEEDKMKAIIQGLYFPKNFSSKIIIKINQSTFSFQISAITIHATQCNQTYTKLNFKNISFFKKTGSSDFPTTGGTHPGGNMQQQQLQKPPFVRTGPVRTPPANYTCYRCNTPGKIFVLRNICFFFFFQSFFCW